MDNILKQNTITLQSLLSKMVSFTSPIMKNIDVCPSWSRFPVKLICCIAFGSASSATSKQQVYLNLSQLSYTFLWNKDNLVNSKLCNHFLDLLQFLNVIICSQISSYWLIKNILFEDHNIKVSYFYLKKKISCMFCSMCIIFKW